jgi:hypothetical protein
MDVRVDDVLEGQILDRDSGAERMGGRSTVHGLS